MNVARTWRPARVSLCCSCTAIRRAHPAGGTRSPRLPSITASSPPTGPGSAARIRRTSPGHLRRRGRPHRPCSPIRSDWTASTSSRTTTAASSALATCSAIPERVMRLALLNTRAHNIFRPWFYRFSLGQRWAAIHAPALLRRLPLRTAASRCAAPVPHARLLRRAPGGRVPRLDGHPARPPAPSSTSSQLPRARGARASPRALARIGCPTAIIWGDRDRYIPFSTATRTGRAHPATRP